MNGPLVPAPIRRLAWATDVHLNFLSAVGLDRFTGTLATSGADAVLLTGDIAEAPSLEQLLEGLARALARPIYFVLGNHDFYRGSVSAVRALAAEIVPFPWLRWLPAAGVVPLAAGVALVGHDGWADGRFGDWERSPVLLNDYILIEDLAGLDKRSRLKAIQRLGDEAASHLRRDLAAAAEGHGRVIVATHVPPFAEACWHEGRISNDDWLPHFTCKAAGEAIREAAEARPGCRFEVLCGHTHGEGVVEIRPNLVVRTGGAEYGEPVIGAVIEVG